MGIDRFVHWKKNKRAGKRQGPSLAQVKAVLRDYLGEAAKEITSDGPTIFALLAGKPSYPFKTIPAYKRFTESVEVHDERWIEIYVTKKSIDIITRQTDEFTNVVADGFSTLAARFWGGELEDH